MKVPSAGSYLVVVPDSWSRDEELSGPPPVAPEPASVAGYCGHYFDLGKESDRPIAFRTPDIPVVLNRNAPRFELIGNKLDDASEDKGHLFSDRPPRIRALDAGAWEQIGTIIVGEEGGGQGKWRMAFTPHPGEREQVLPAETQARKGGWYFLRFYDTDNVLVESLDFRFVSGLKAITVSNHSPLPSAAGHASAHVEFIHEPDCAVQPTTEHEGSVPIAREAQRTALTIPPDPSMDQTRWFVVPRDGSKTDVTIRVERIWWAIGEENEHPTDWIDRQVTLKRDNFAATSNKAMWIWLPMPRWVDAVHIGFGQQKLRQYSVKVTDRSVVIPLRDFGEEIADDTSEHHLMISVERNETVVNRVIGIIPSDVTIGPGREPPAQEIQAGGLKKSPLLNLDTVSVPRLANVLTVLRRDAVGPLAHLLKEVRRGCPTRRTTHQSGSTEFAKKGLCVIALTLEIGGEELLGSLGQKKKGKWSSKARLASGMFPEISSMFRKRYDELQAGHRSRPPRVRDRRNIA